MVASPITFEVRLGYRTLSFHIPACNLKGGEMKINKKLLGNKVVIQPFASS